MARTAIDFPDPMPLRMADRYLGIESGSVGAAYRRGEVETVGKPGGKRRRVTKKALKEWVRRYWR